MATSNGLELELQLQQTRARLQEVIELAANQSRDAASRQTALETRLAEREQTNVVLETLGSIGSTRSLLNDVYMRSKHVIDEVPMDQATRDALKSRLKRMLHSLAAEREEAINARLHAASKLGKKERPDGAPKRKCVSCHFHNPPTAQFCGGCGAPVGGSVGSATGTESPLAAPPQAAPESPMATRKVPLQSEESPMATKKKEMPSEQPSRSPSRARNPPESPLSAKPSPQSSRSPSRARKMSHQSSRSPSRARNPPSRAPESPTSSSRASSPTASPRPPTAAAAAPRQHSSDGLGGDRGSDGTAREQGSSTAAGLSAFLSQQQAEEEARASKEKELAAQRQAELADERKRRAAEARRRGGVVGRRQAAAARTAKAQRPPTNPVSIPDAATRNRSRSTLDDKPPVWLRSVSLSSASERKLAPERSASVSKAPPSSSSSPNQREDAAAPSPSAAQPPHHSRGPSATGGPIGRAVSAAPSARRPSRMDKTDKTAPREAAAAARASDDSVLAANWVEAKTKDGDIYYYHRHNRAVRWDRPTPELAAKIEAREVSLRERQAERVAALERESQAADSRAQEEQLARERVHGMVESWAGDAGWKMSRRNPLGKRDARLVMVRLLTSLSRLPKLPCDAPALEESASIGDVRKAFHRVARGIHPDRLRGHDTEVVALASSTFAVLSAALDAATSSS